MPSPGKAWYHVTLGTYASWLPGDPRGFRDRKHRIHSSGDHRNPPPVGEHQRLYAYSKQHSGPATVVPKACREVIGKKLVDHLRALNHRVLAMAVSDKHVHVLVELPVDREACKHEISRCKQAAALAVRERINRKLWGKGAGFKQIKDRSHQLNVYCYIARHRDEGAWVWVFEGKED